MKHYPDIDPNPNFPDIETNILSSWKAGNIFEQSIAERNAANEFVFYDGPPFANGLPHYGHLLTGYVKDVFARYQTMRGKRVERRFGWDCHGLPAEMGSEKELGISGRAAITEFGIGKFNEHCRTSVMKYTSEWEDYVNRQARWVDFKNDYKTMDKNFMESVLWAFKQLYDKGLVYEAYRVMPYSWAAETPLSNFETKLDNSYREREDKAITVAFELNEAPKSLSDYRKPIVALAWTTTPWTLPSNLALAVSKEIDYVAVHGEERIYILSKKRYKDAYESLLAPMAKERKNNEEVEPLHTVLAGNELFGLTYKPLFPYFADRAKRRLDPAQPHSGSQDDTKGAFRILDGSSFVTDGDGTGIVHMAPGFGEDDQKCCEANGIEVVVPVNGQGKYTDAVFDIPLKPSPSGRGLGEGNSGPNESPHPYPLPEGEGVLSLKGLNVIADTRKDEAEPYTEAQLKKFGLANLRIINYLKQTGQLIKQEDFKHNYPHCWRTDQPLIYRAMPSWYVEVTKFRDRAVEINKTINWIPDHIRDGQMAHMLATAPDWSISRNRFWGTPIPVWRAKSGKIIVIGSIEELEKLSGKKVQDLHRPYIDEITIEKDGETYTRVEDVFDCWFESGSMPFAQVHYPFENKEWFETHFPADFITEYVGQTRGWFNTLIMLSTALFDKAPFKNCICHGVVLDSETGLKYSKRLKNYKDPMEVMDKFGADALRWLMISSPVMRGHDLAVDPEGKFIRDVVRLAIKPIWNAYNFFTLYANADGINASMNADSGHMMDMYILAKCSGTIEQIKTSLDAYDTPSACEAVMQFFEVLNNWYIRRSKERFWKEEKDADKQAAYDTLYTVLVTMCKAAAPLLPLTLDAVYKGLKPSPSGRGLGEGYVYEPKKLIENARALRKNSTDVEQILWSFLRNRQLNGFKFRRQHPIEKYVLDFYCESAKLAVELDGGQHSEQQSYDENRTKFLESQGIKVLRFWNNDVLENLEGVYQRIEEALKFKEQPSPNPLPEGEGFLSVHLTDFPSITSTTNDDEKLIAQMDWVQDVCNAGLAIRNKINIRVRQPLALLEIHGNVPIIKEWFYSGNADLAKTWDSLREVIKDELNIKDVQVLNTDESLKAVAVRKLQINSQILGKRLPEKMKQILPASKKGEWEYESTGKGVVVAGEQLNPHDNEYIILLEPKPDYAPRAQALSTNDALVILDIEITPELKREGLARDLVRAIQQARKDAGLQVTDRIELGIVGDIADVLADSDLRAYIQHQTLTTTMSGTLIQEPMFQTEAVLDELKVMITLNKVA